MRELSRIGGVLAAVLLAAGCVSFSGSGLTPGKSTRADVESEMGKPAAADSKPNGETYLYFSRLPLGRKMYLAKVGPDGVLRGIEQTLTKENIAKLKADMTQAEVRELLGPTWRSVYLPRIDRDVWEYPWQLVEDRRILWVQFSRDGRVREVVEMHDFESDPPSGHTKD
jgi:outer membrane protein assembly factor BamE (lipoprotein component of BamABCDE complex)